MNKNISAIVAGTANVAVCSWKLSPVQSSEARFVSGPPVMVLYFRPSEEGLPEIALFFPLFVYITDGHNNVATANIPFYVK